MRCWHQPGMIYECTICSTHTHMNSYVGGIFPKLYGDAQNCSLTRSFPSLSVHITSNKSCLSGTSTVHQIKESIINSTVSVLLLSNARTPFQTAPKKWTPNIILLGCSSFPVLVLHINCTEWKWRRLKQILAGPQVSLFFDLYNTWK